jgi:hypothetical protein
VSAGGRPTFKYTRLEVAGILECLAAGQDIDFFATQMRKAEMAYTTVYKKEGCVKLDYNAETGVIYVTWKIMYDQNETRHVCEETLKLVQKGGKVIIIDMLKTKGAVLEETQHWFQNYLFLRFSKAGTLRVIINIDGEIPLVRLAASTWTQKGAGFPFDMVTVRSREEAANVAAEYLSK